MKSSLYAQYLKERCGRGTLETKEGFATFDYVSEDIVYIVDLYVQPKYRKTRVAATLADKIVEQAIKDGKKFLLGSVDVTAKGAEASCKVLEAYGMTIHKVAEPMIFYVKQIAPVAELKEAA
jgi:ribosomal protein S18 acetylase RimI-like enzyme